MNEHLYRLQEYQIILADYASEIVNNPKKYSGIEKLRKLNLSYAQKCLALENADLSPPEESNNEKADDL